MEQDDISLRQTLVRDGLTVMETTSPKYHDRTVANARWADMTIAFAVDFSTAGERLTRKAAGDRYLAVDMPASRDALYSEEYRERIADMLAHNTEHLHSFNLNIAGNGLQTLQAFGIGQSDVDDFIAAVIGLAVSEGMDVGEIRSGGQSGVDEAGTKAAMRFGIPASQIVPKGFLYNDAEGSPHWNRQSFLARFEGIQKEPLPKKPLDISSAMAQAMGEGRSDSIGLTLSQRSSVPGAVVGDILAAPYRLCDADVASFEFFRPNSFRSHGETVNHHCTPTDVSRLSIAVADWLVFGAHDSEADLKRRFPDAGRMGSSGIAAALSVVGVYTDHLLEARDLARKGAGAFGLRGEDADMCEACCMAVFMAAHGRDRHEIRFSMEEDYNLDLTAAIAGLEASEMLSEGKHMPEVCATLLQNRAVSIVRDESQKRMEEGISFYTMEEILPRTMQMVKETAYVNGEPINYEVRSDRRSISARDTLPLALASFLTSFSFEESVRRVILCGGDSPSIAAMAGALSAAYYGGVPNTMAQRCMLTLDSSQKDALNVFTKVSAPSRVKDPMDDTVKVVSVHTVHGQKFSAMRYPDMQVSWALRQAGVEVVSMKELKQILSEVKVMDSGTPFDGVDGGTRVLYVTNDGLRSATELDMPGMPSREIREKSRAMFEQLSDYCGQVRTRMERIAGYDDHGGRQPHLKFPTACYPSRRGDSILIFDHSVVDGSIELDSWTGLVKVNYGGELREGEYKDADWCREHVLDSGKIATFSLSEGLPEDWRKNLGHEGLRFGKEEMLSLSRLQRESGTYTLDLDGLKSAIARACLDEGVGIYDTRKESNIERLHKDILDMARDAQKQLHEGEAVERRHGGMKL